ncbi:Hypothetical predicted protein [Olea europaea subsp. europaea]|uniref:Uncharacterized protein n=1 Tax=Olea europaea subsp. europaea TaxID=158383 RepID=A0A8S0QVB6_OLEEU|nr:Hypothetical predicted protein [Olea europaea subsp. europaea]
MACTRCPELPENQAASLQWPGRVPDMACTRCPELPENQAASLQWPGRVPDMACTRCPELPENQAASLPAQNCLTAWGLNTVTSDEGRAMAWGGAGTGIRGDAVENAVFRRETVLVTGEVLMVVVAFDDGDVVALFGSSDDGVVGGFFLCVWSWWFLVVAEVDLVAVIFVSGAVMVVSAPVVTG